MRKKNQLFSFIIILLLISVLTACGKNDDITPFKEGLQSFYDNTNKISASLNNIDPNQESATDDTLAILDSMNATFDTLAELKIPDEYTNVSPLIQSAITNMHNANNLYHQAYANNSYDDALGQNAKNYYNNAFSSVKNIGEILMGHELSN